MQGLKLPCADTSTLHKPTMHSECLVHMLCYHNRNVSISTLQAHSLSLLCYHNKDVLVSTEGLHAEFQECVMSESQIHSPTLCEQFPCTFCDLVPVLLSYYPFILSFFYPYILIFSHLSMSTEMCT